MEKCLVRCVVADFTPIREMFGYILNKSDDVIHVLSLDGENVLLKLTEKSKSISDNIYHVKGDIYAYVITGDFLEREINQKIKNDKNFLHELKQEELEIKLIMKNTEKIIQSMMDFIS